MQAGTEKKDRAVRRAPFALILQASQGPGNRPVCSASLWFWGILGWRLPIFRPNEAPDSRRFNARAQAAIEVDDLLEWQMPVSFAMFDAKPVDDVYRLNELVANVAHLLCCRVPGIALNDEWTIKGGGVDRWICFQIACWGSSWMVPVLR